MIFNNKLPKKWQPTSWHTEKFDNIFFHLFDRFREELSTKKDTKKYKKKFRFHWSEKLKFPCISFMFDAALPQFDFSFIFFSQLFNDIEIVVVNIVAVRMLWKKKNLQKDNQFFYLFRWLILKNHVVITGALINVL